MSRAYEIFNKIYEYMEMQTDAISRNHNDLAFLCAEQIRNLEKIALLTGVFKNQKELDIAFMKWIEEEKGL